MKILILQILIYLHSKTCIVKNETMTSQKHDRILCQYNVVNLEYKYYHHDLIPLHGNNDRIS